MHTFRFSRIWIAFATSICFIKANTPSGSGSFPSRLSPQPGLFIFWMWMSRIHLRRIREASMMRIRLSGSRPSTSGEIKIKNQNGYIFLLRLHAHCFFGTRCVTWLSCSCASTRAHGVFEPRPPCVAESLIMSQVPRGDSKHARGSCSGAGAAHAGGFRV